MQPVCDGVCVLQRGNELAKQQIHPTSIISGYRLASKEACKYINDVLSTTVEKLGRESLVNAARTSMSSKVIGPDSDFFAPLVVEAVLRVKTSNTRGVTKYPLKAINVLKCHGKSLKETQFVPGYALNCTAASQAMPRLIKNAKVACLDFNLTRHKMSHGVSIVCEDPTQIEALRERESDIVKERVQMILATGATVVLTTKGIDDLVLKYFVEAGAMAVRRVLKKDLLQIAKACGARVIVSLASTDDDETGGTEKFDASYLGSAEEVAQEYVSDRELIMFRVRHRHQLYLHLYR